MSTKKSSLFAIFLCCVTFFLYQNTATGKSGSSVCDAVTGEFVPSVCEQDSIRNAERTLESLAQGKKLTNQDVLWSKAIVAAYKNSNWVEALPLWQAILGNEPDNPKALFSAALVADYLAATKPTGLERTALFNSAVSYYSKLFAMPHAEAGLRAIAAVHLVVIHGKAGELVAARKIFEAMASLGNTEGIKEQRAMAAANLIVMYSNPAKPDLEAVRAVFATMASLSDAETAKNQWRTMAAMNVIAAHGDAGQIDAEILTTQRAKAAANLVKTYIDFGKLEAARAIFDAILSLGNAEIVTEQRATAAANLINTYIQAGKLNTARDIFYAMPSPYQGETAKREYAKAAISLINSYRQTWELDAAHLEHELSQGRLNVTQARSVPEKLDAARDIFYAMPAGLGDTEGAEVAANLVNAYLRDFDAIDKLHGGFKALFNYTIPEWRHWRARRFDTARAILDAMVKLGDTEAIREWRAKAAMNLIAAYAKGNTLEELKAGWATFDSMVGFGESVAIQEQRAKAALYLIDAYKAVDSKAARAIFDSMASLGDSAAVKEQRAKAASIINGSPGHL